MAKKPETKFKEKVARALKDLPNTWFVKIQQVAIRGIPDFLICINGQFIGIELKKDKEAARNPLQEWTLEAICNAGGFSYLVYPENWENTLASLEDFAGDTRAPQTKSN